MHLKPTWAKKGERRKGGQLKEKEREEGKEGKREEGKMALGELPEKGKDTKEGITDLWDSRHRQQEGGSPLMPGKCSGGWGRMGMVYARIAKGFRVQLAARGSQVWCRLPTILGQKELVVGRTEPSRWPCGSQRQWQLGFF